MLDEENLADHPETLEENKEARSEGKIQNEDSSSLMMNKMQREISTGSCGSCMMDLPEDSAPRLANSHSFKTTYRLTKEELKHASLNLEVPVSGRFERPNTRYRERNIPYALETVDRHSLPSTPFKGTRRSRDREMCSRRTASAYRQAQNVQHSRERLDRRNLPGPSTQQAQNVQHSRERLDRRNLPGPPMQQVNAMRSSSQPPRQPSMQLPRQPTNLNSIDPVSRIVRWVNHRPFFHFDRLFEPFPFLFDRGFDDDGFFFFAMHTGNPEPQENRPQGATREQIEKAISQLTGVGSDLEIKKGDSCPICLEQFKTTDDVVEMPCPCKRTFFHRQCAIKTLEMTKKIKCPNCRRWDGKT